ncbi:excisionase family DNA-binding protein [Ramlibacter sp. 2FC]|uniref:excisionase family DNA-binding protein n=1 Tax=Ramlibacter sp. 2FC TaxID=2502188 RepID=UPI0010F66D19|nr:excisionase family DNA-binding protein [Ramlibacter sp. 2FC]
MAHDDTLYSTREAAERLGVSLRTVQLWVEGGVLRAWKTAGGHRRIPREAIDELLAQRRAELLGSPSPSQFKLLVVEDEADLLKLYRLQIAAWALPVTLVTANNGFDALIRIGEQRPDLLVTDLNMPGMDGFRMIRTLRASPDFADMEIVAVTALGRAEIADRGGLPPDVRIFTKPVPFSELERIVRERLARPMRRPQPA